MCLWIMTDRGWRPWHASNIPCPNSNNLQGVYKPEPIAAVQWNLDTRIDRFLEANGIQNLMLKQEFFSGNSFLDKGHPELRGAFGEKL